MSTGELARTLGMSPADLTRTLDFARLAAPLAERLAPQLNAIAEATPPTWALQRAAGALASPAVERALTAIASPVMKDAAVVAAPILRWGAPVFTSPVVEVAATHVIPELTSALPALIPMGAQASPLAGLALALPALADIVPAFGTIEVFRRQNYLQLMSLTRAMRPLPDAIVDLFRDWWRTAGRGGPDQLLAAQAYAAALEVREVILRQPESREAVAEFGRRWLNFRSMPPSRIEATVAALLDDDWVAEVFAPDFGRRMRTRVNRQHIVHRPIMERQLSGQHVMSLHEPVGWNPATTTPVTMLDLAAAPDTVELVVLDRFGGWDDDRIERVLARLDDRERAVAEAYAQGGPDITWMSAAERLGMDIRYGTRVQRKLQREGKKLVERLAAVGDSDRDG
jgi:hypothetical protein